MRLHLRCAAAAAALLCAAPMAAHAQSNVTVYGIVDATVRYATNAGGGGGHLYTVGDGAYTGSRLGFRGNEDLGDGLKAFFSLEQGFDPSAGTLNQATSTPNYGQSAAPNGRMFGRESLVGLTLYKAGTVTLGRQYTLAHVLSGRFQPQSNPNQDSLSVLSGHHVARQDNMAKYMVDLGSFNVSVSKTLGEGTNGAACGVGGSYTAGPLDLVAYAQHMDSFNDAETRKIWGAGGSYAFNTSIKAFLGYMKRDHRVSLQENKVWTGGVNYGVGQFIFTASYTEDRQSGVNEGSRKVGWLGADYLLSKRTDLYVEVDNNKLTGSYPLPGFMSTRDSQTGVSAGLRHRF
jgi:predicted porin